MIHPRSISIAAILCSLTLLLGCGSTAPGGRSADQAFASTKIELLPRYNIEQATITMFRTEGFQLTHRQTNQLTFQRVGDAYTQEVYGDSFAPGVQVKADVLVTEPEFGLIYLSCDVSLLPPGAARWLPAREGRPEFRGLLKKIKKLAGVM